MLSEERAERLALRGTRRRDNGARGPRARRAWRRLVEAGDRRDSNAVSAVWRAWLADPDDELWAELARWRGGRFLADEAFAAAVQPERAPGERAAIGAFCVRHGLVPEDAIERALFFALTGQAGQERATDPDGSLLAGAYRAADLPTRAALRQAMAGAGHLDLARVVGGADRAVPMTAEESEYLVRQLAGRGDWAALWRLVQDLPPVSAVRAVRWFDDGWRPASEAGRAFFDRLAGLPVDAGTWTPDALTRTATRHLKVPGWVWAGSFSPDGRRLVVLVYLGDNSPGPRDGEAHVFELPSGRLIERYEARFDPSGPVVHLGEAFVAKDAEEGLIRSSGGRNERLHQPVGDIAALAHHGSGFAVLRSERTGNRRRSRILICNRSGQVMHSAMAHSGHDPGPSWLAVEPGSGWLAVGDGQDFWLFDPSARRVLGASPRGSSVTSACFLGPGRLVTLINGGDHITLETWLLAGRGLVCGAERRRTTRPYFSPAREIIPVPELGEVMIRDGGTVRYLDGETFAEVTDWRPLQGRQGSALWGLAGGGAYALAREGLVEVTDTRLAAVLPLVDRPQTQLRPSDLAAVNLAAPLGEGAEARSLESLLRACLEHRFAAEITLGEIPAAGPEDIALSAGGDPPC